MQYSTGFIAVCFLLMCAPACALLDPSEPQGRVTARATDTGLSITNHTNARVYYFAVGRETADRIDWGRHQNQEQSVAIDQTIDLPSDSIFRVLDEREVVVYWWHTMQDDLQSIDLQL